MTEISDSLITPAEKKTTDPKKPESTPETTTSSTTTSHIGDGAHHDVSGGGTHDTSEDAFRAAIGLESGNRGNTSFTTEQFNREVGQGAGISRGQVVKYTDADGNEIQGGQYHNKQGTFFKTPEGDTYKVQADNGTYTLQPTKDGQQPIQATSRDVVSNNFGRWGNRTRGDGDNNGNNNGANNGGDNNGLGTRNRPPKDGDAATPPAATTTTDKAAVVPAVSDRTAAVTPAVSTDTRNPAVAPTVPTDKSVAAVTTATTTGGGDHPASVVAPTSTRIDPATFYNSFKGATDQQQRDLLTSSLSSIPRDQRPDFIKQVTEVAIRTDRANASDVLTDLGRTAKQVKNSLDNPTAAQPNPVVPSDKPVNVTPSPVNNKDVQPPVVQPGGLQSGLGPGQGKDNQGWQKPDSSNPVPANLAQFVKNQINNGDNNGPQILRPNQNPDGNPKIVTAVEGTILNKGNFNQGGDNNGQNRGIPGQPGQGPIDAAQLIQKLQNQGAQPGDKIVLGPDNKQFQPVQLPPDLTRGHGQGDGNNLGAQAVARGIGADQTQPALPQQKGGIPGLDLNDPHTRQFLADALKQIQATKVGDFDPRSQNQNLQDILKGFDPHKIDKLQAFLNPDGKSPITDAAVGRLAAILNPTDRVTGTAATDITLGQKLAIDRLTDLVRNNQNLIDLQNMQIRDGRLLHEVNRLVGDVNKQFGFEGKNVLTLSDIIGRSLDGTRGGERGLGLEGKTVATAATNLDPLSFTARLTPQQEQAIRALLDLKDARLANVDAHAIQRPTDMPGKPDPMAKIETNVKAELTNRPEQKADAKHEPTAKELASAKELVGREQQGKDQGKDLAARELVGKELSGKELPGKEQPGKQELAGKDLGNKAELNVKGELISKGHDQIIRPEIKDSKEERGEKFDPHSPFGKHDNNATNLDGSKKIRDEKELAEKQKDEKERLEEEQQRREAALLALMADRKLREDKEKQQKEQEKVKDKKQDEDTRRRRYVVRERDTLESIASKQHRDGKLAPLIYEINRKEIAMKVVNGKEVPDLRPRQVIWLPSEVDIKEFRKRMHSGSTSNVAGDENLSAEDELTARFGSNWGGTASGADTDDGGATSAAPQVPMTPEAMAAAQARRANIEKLLGPLSKQRPADGRIRYVVRLGDTLKTVAMKHPSLQDISLWPLLAEINEISVETDDKGIPLAKLSRGSTVMIPTAEEIQLYREQHGARSNPAAKATKPCPHCGRLSSIAAAICGACAHSFNLDSKPANATNDAGMMVMQAAGFVQKPGVPLAKRPAPPDTMELEPAPVIPPPLYEEGSQLAVVQLDEQTRLARCMIHGENPSTVVAIEVRRDDSWKAVVAYEIFPQSSMRHEYYPRGDRKSVRIDLPTEAILELSNNDLKTNWKNYRDRYFAQLISLNR